MPSCKQFSSVVSEEKIFKDKTSKTQKTSKKGNDSHITLQINTKFGREVDLVILNKSFTHKKFAKPYHF